MPNIQGSIPGSGRESPMGRRAWWATVHGVAELGMPYQLNSNNLPYAGVVHVKNTQSWMQLSDWAGTRIGQSCLVYKNWLAFLLSLLCVGHKAGWDCAVVFFFFSSSSVDTLLWLECRQDSSQADKAQLEPSETTPSVKAKTRRCPSKNAKLGPRSGFNNSFC